MIRSVIHSIQRQTLQGLFLSLNQEKLSKRLHDLCNKLTLACIDCVLFVEETLDKHKGSFMESQKVEHSHCGELEPPMSVEVGLGVAVRVHVVELV